MRPPPRKTMTSLRSDVKMANNELIVSKEELKATYERATAGDAEAQYRLGKHLVALEPDELAEDDPTEDEKKTMARVKEFTAELIEQRDGNSWILQAAEHGHARAMTNHACRLFQRGDKAGGMKWLEKAGAKGDGQAMWFLAVRYAQASEDNRENPFKRLIMLFTGDKNRSAAIEWYKKTISDGDDENYKKMARSNLKRLTGQEE